MWVPREVEGGGWRGGLEGGGCGGFIEKTYLEVETGGLVFGIKWRILTSLLEQTVQLFFYI